MALPSIFAQRQKANISMLCEKCNEREATVHLAFLDWPTGELAKHLCDSCSEGADATCSKPYGSQPSSPLPTDVEQISAEQFLSACEKAAANGADRPALRHIFEELNRFPAARERLALEFLQMALKSLEAGGDPIEWIIKACSFGGSVQVVRSADYAEMLEKIILRSVDLLVPFPELPVAHPFAWGLETASMALTRIDPTRFTTVISACESKGDELERSQRRKIIMTLQEKLAKTGSILPMQITPQGWRMRVDF
jgi:hypothetical protein